MKRVVTGMALALAMSAYAGHPQTINKSGFVGVNKTQSAQSLGHSKLVFVGLADATFGNDMFPEGVTEYGLFTDGSVHPIRNGEVNDYLGVSANVGFAIGIWHYFDLGVTLPVYYDKFYIGNTHPENTEFNPCFNGTTNFCDDVPGTNVGYIGNIDADLKIRFPLPDDQPFDLAIFGGASMGTANPEKDGLWIRNPEYIHTTTGTSQAYGSKNTTLRGGAAATLDFGKLNDGDGFPFLLHVNGGYKYTVDGSFNKAEYLSYPYMTAAAEVYFMNFMSLFAEYYWAIQLDPFTYNIKGAIHNHKLDMKQLTGALVFHLPIGMDIHLGGSYYLGGRDLNDNFIYAETMENPGREGLLYKTRVNPEYTVYGGITWSGFLLAQDRDGDGVVDKEDKCPDDFGHRLNQGCPLGNPDADEDGVCDSWVAEKGFQAEFSDVCEGVDQCPNEAGEGDDGCPLDDPDPDKDGVCDAWVSQKKMLKKFNGVCEGIDECPNQAGAVQFNGCPSKQPDPDGDGMCSPWVTDEGALDQFASQCKGYDMCPGEAGAKANKGCPWDDPDSDNDGLCDEWVTQKKMGYYFEKAAEDQKMAKEWFIEKSCKGIDKCPTEFGPANNEGCPLGNPDVDEDGVCDAWVTEKGMLDQYDGICVGLDKCPNEKGAPDSDGCPMDNPDADGDGLCASWVTEKNLQSKFAEVCHGVDNCPAEAGPEWNKGCPGDEPDPDGDGVCSPWVTKKKMLDKFTDICTGSDKCEDEAGPAWNKGCPAEDPDPDGDSLCSPWVTKQKMLDQFKDVCHGKDQCEDEAGPEWNKGCPADDPDPDKDGLCSPWVTKQKMLPKFADICKGYDRCEDEAGPDWNNGCPSDEDPDADKDGVCSEWVTTKKLTKQFADVCSGIDRCPDIFGDDGHGCPKKAVEKLDGVTFKSGKATLESNAKMILKNVAKKLNTDEYKDLQIVIQGHTDNVGKEKANQKLSENRAKEVMKTLTKAGVNKKRIKAIGMGSSCPVDDNKTADGREMNRRIEMHFASPDNDGTKCESNYVAD